MSFIMYYSSREGYARGAGIYTRGEIVRVISRRNKFCATGACIYRGGVAPFCLFIGFSNSNYSA